MNNKFTAGLGAPDDDGPLVSRGFGARRWTVTALIRHLSTMPTRWRGPSRLGDPLPALMYSTAHW